MSEVLCQRSRRQNVFRRGRGIVLGLALGLCAVVLSWAHGNQARGPNNKIAGDAVPSASGDVGLPEILGKLDIGLYRRIFMLQESGKWKAADRLIKRLDDEVLMGHVMFQRYMHPRKYRSRYKELKGWLAKYADHPGAARVYKLALRRRPKNYHRPKAPVGPRTARGYADLVVGANYRSPRKRSRAQRRRVRQIQSRIRRNVRREILTVSQKYLDRREVIKLLDTVERDALLSRVSASGSIAATPKRPWPWRARRRRGRASIFQIPIGLPACRRGAWAISNGRRIISMPWPIPPRPMGGTGRRVPSGRRGPI